MPSRSLKLWRLGLAGLLIMILIVGAVLGWGWMRLRERPEWWSPLEATETSVQELGDHTENFVLNRIHKRRPTSDSAWEMRMSEDMINSWLAWRLPRWLANRDLDDSPWVRDLQQTQVVLEAGLAQLGARMASSAESHGQVLAVEFEPVEDALSESTAGVRVRLSEIHMGGLTLPRDVLLDMIIEAIGGGSDRDEIVGWLDGEPVTPTIKLADGRSVRVLGMRLELDEVVLRCETTRGEDR